MLPTQFENELTAFNIQNVPAPDGFSVAVRTPQGSQLTIPRPEHDGHDVTGSADLPVAAIRSLAHAEQRIAEVMNDPRLSTIGKTTDLEPIKRTLAVTVAGLANEVNTKIAAVEAMEQTRNAIEKPTTQQAAEDEREIRAAVSRIYDASQAKALEMAKQADEPVLRAIHNNPLRNFGILHDYAKARLRELIDARDPEGRETLDEMRSRLDWAQRSLFVAAAAARRVLQMNDFDLLSMLQTTDGAEAFGISPLEIEKYKRVQAVKARLKAK